MATPFSPYQRRLFAFLGVATFFEGYDFLALANILPNLRADFGLTPQQAGALLAVVNFGTVVAWLLVRKADVWGRKPVLTLTIAGYTLATLVSGLAPNVWIFALAQLVARVFLIGEWATSMVYAAEEFPDERRGFVIGAIQAFSSLGAVFCAGITPILLGTSLGWRAVYLAGVIPLVLLAYARRDLRETARFEAREVPPPSSLFALTRTHHLRRVLQVGAVWFLTYLCTQTAVSLWKEFAVSERGLDDAAVGRALVLASLVSMPLVFAAGRLLDAVGRRAGAVVIYGVTIAGVWAAYSLHGATALTVALTAAIFGVSAVLAVMNALTTELFPTDVRADAFAWTNNLIGRVGYVIAPIVVGWAAERWGWGAAIRPTVLGPILALGLILAWLPETRQKPLA
ncbi:MAG: MFS transporter [Myxococcales bacterium]|nr:MFS transporter [Myxococcales bacterium]MCB9530834.1 MFS transporter [Myxococcales bacterium]